MGERMDTEISGIDIVRYELFVVREIEGLAAVARVATEMLMSAAVALSREIGTEGAIDVLKGAAKVLVLPDLRAAVH
jgi:hypothetical protein